MTDNHDNNTTPKANLSSGDDPELLATVARIRRRADERARPLFLAQLAQWATEDEEAEESSE